MAIHLIDGHLGKAHVTSDDVAAINAACLGVENGVFDYGAKFRTNTYSGNTVAIYDGVGMVKGRRFTSSATEQVKLASGTSGMKRIDLICASYSKSSSTGPSGTDFSESVTLQVVKGTPHASAPTAPSAPRDSLPLWRVPFNGTSMGTPQQAFVLIPTIDSLRVQKLYENDFWRVVRHGGAVSVFACGVRVGADSYSTVDCKYTVPEGLRPAKEVLAACVTQSGDSGAGFIRVKSDGTISMGQLGSAGTNEPRYAQLTWVPGM